MASLRHRTLLWCALGTAGSACADNSGPSAASFVVVTVTSGSSIDTDGYTVRIDASRRESLGATDTLIVAGLAPGEHQVELQEVASNCTVSAGSTRTVNTTSSDSVLVQFDVVCSGAAGTLQLVTATAGEDLDPSGYVALVSDVRAVSIGANSVVSTSFPTGSYQVTLDGIAGNCVLDGPNPRPVNLPRGGIGRLDFALRCSATTPAGRGHEIAFVRRSGEGNGSVFQRLHMMNEDGTSVRTLPTIFESFLMDPHWLSDGERMGFLAEEQSCFPVFCARPYLLTVATGVRQPVSPIVLDTEANWSPDGTRIVFRDPSCFVDCGDEPVTIDIVVAQVDGSFETRISSDSVAYFSPTWLPDGTALLYVRAADGLLDIVRRGADGSGETAVGRNFAGELLGISELAPSPDGSRVAFSAQPSDPGFETPIQVYVMDLDGGDPVALTSGPANNFDPTWSPDGRYIALVSDRDGNDEIYVMNADGTGQQRLTNNPAFDGQPAWRP